VNTLTSGFELILFQSVLIHENLVQHCPIEISVMLEMFFIRSFNTVTTGHMWLMSICNMAR